MWFIMSGSMFCIWWPSSMNITDMIFEIQPWQPGPAPVEECKYSLLLGQVMIATIVQFVRRILLYLLSQWNKISKVLQQNCFFTYDNWEGSTWCNLINILQWNWYYYIDTHTYIEKYKITFDIWILSDCC